MEVGEKREKSLHKSMSSEKRTAILTKNLQSQVYGEKDSAFWMRSILRRRLSECAAPVGVDAHIDPGAAAPSGGFLSARAERNQRHAQEGDFVFPLLRTTPHRPSTRGAAAPLIGSNPRGNETWGRQRRNITCRWDVPGRTM